MPRNAVRLSRAKKRGVSRRRYPPDDIARALHLVQHENFTIQQASKETHIPRSTIHFRLTHPEATRSGPKTILTAQEEKDLVTFLFEMSNLGLAISRELGNAFALNVVVSDGRQHPWNTPNSNGPGRDWWEGFIGRHPEMTLRIPPKPTRTRPILTKPFLLVEFLDKLSDLYEKHHYRPDLIAVYDETKGDPKLASVLSKKGQRNLFSLTDEEGRPPQISVGACINASGQRMPPLFIHQGRTVDPEEWSRDCFPGAMFSATESGESDVVVFEGWFDQFVRWININRSQSMDRALLIFDGQESHISPNLLAKANQHNVDILQLSPRAPPVPFRVWIARFHEIIGKFRTNPAMVQLTKALFAAIMKPAWTHTISSSGVKREKTKLTSDVVPPTPAQAAAVAAAHLLDRRTTGNTASSNMNASNAVMNSLSPLVTTATTFGLGTPGSLNPNAASTLAQMGIPVQMQMQLGLPVQPPVPVATSTPPIQITTTSATAVNLNPATTSVQVPTGSVPQPLASEAQTQPEENDSDSTGSSSPVVSSLQSNAVSAAAVAAAAAAVASLPPEQQRAHKRDLIRMLKAQEDEIQRLKDALQKGTAEGETVVTSPIVSAVPGSTVSTSGGATSSTNSIPAPAPLATALTTTDPTTATSTATTIADPDPEQPDGKRARTSSDGR